VEGKRDGHREYAAERKAKLLQLTTDLRTSDSLLTAFAGNPDQTAKQYGLRLTEEEVSAIAAITGSTELDTETLAAVAGGSFGDSRDTQSNCGCNEG
jgi:hypothetical protein